MGVLLCCCPKRDKETAAPQKEEEGLIEKRIFKEEEIEQSVPNNHCYLSDIDQEHSD